MTTHTPTPAQQDFVATELRGIIDVCGDSPTAIVSVERMRLWLSKLRAPVADQITDHEIGALWASTPNPGRVVAFARALLSRQASAPVASADVMDALNWVDDFIARCNRDDRGSCESVNVLRRALASAPVADERPNGLPDPHGCNKCQHPECGRFNGPRQVECRAMAENACARDYASASAPVAGEAQPTAYLTLDEEGSPSMLFFDVVEARTYCALDEEPEPLFRHPAPQASEAVPHRLLAAKHVGMCVDYTGLIGQARSALKRGEAAPALAEMLHQLAVHLTELGQRWYAEDAAVVDEFLQLYCIESDTRAALSAQPGAQKKEGA